MNKWNKMQMALDPSGLTESCDQCNKLMVTADKLPENARPKPVVVCPICEKELAPGDRLIAEKFLDNSWVVTHLKPTQNQMQSESDLPPGYKRWCCKYGFSAALVDSQKVTEQCECPERPFKIGELVRVKSDLESMNQMERYCVGEATMWSLRGQLVRVVCWGSHADSVKVEGSGPFWVPISVLEKI